MERTRWIVVGTDFSEAADRALEHAVRLAVKSKASLACVNAFEDAPGALASVDDPTPTLRAELADAVARSGAESQGVHVELFVRRGPPWDKILNVASDMGADLIVVGAQGQRGALHGFFLGSVVTRLAATSTRCVLIVPANLDAGLGQACMKPSPARADLRLGNEPQRS
jgi:nucleotide-binding universal stress UspA family protein